MRAYVRILVCTIALVWKSEGSLEKSDLSFYPAGFGVLIQVVRLHWAIWQALYLFFFFFERRFLIKPGASECRFIDWPTSSGHTVFSASSALGLQFCVIILSFCMWIQTQFFMLTQQACYQRNHPWSLDLSFSFRFLILGFTYIYAYDCMNLCVKMPMEAKRRTLDSLELELLAVVSYRWVQRTEPGSSGSTTLIPEPSLLS